MFERIKRWLWPAPAPTATPPRRPNFRRAAALAAPLTDEPRFPIQAPQLPPGVVPKGATAPALAMDSVESQFLMTVASGQGFPGYPYLSQLSTRAEFRAFAEALSTEVTREWLTITSKSEEAEDGRVKELEAEFKRLGVREIIQKAVEHDAFFGRAQIFVDCCPDDARDTPLILSPKTIAPGSLKKLAVVEAVWTTPATYNAVDPIAPDFFKPSSWFMLGQKVHASRLMTVITRPLPDLMKPAFNFGGMSLSQLAEPYVENWLRTRQSVADLINNFSISVLATDMTQLLGADDEDDGGNLMNRAALFTQMRSNKGLMVLDKEREELVQVNTPLSGLHELQAQSQEHMCSVSHIPAIKLTGISPSGLNASSDGEIRVFYDGVAAQQSAYWSDPVETILQVVQLSLWGRIDPDIGFVWNPLYQMTPAELADIRLKNSQAAATYIDHAVIDPSEERERLARDPESGYLGLDTDLVIVEPEVAQDAGFEEGKHPRADNGQFGSGGGGKGALTKREASAVSSYSGDDFLRVNTALRGGDESDPLVTDLDSAISKSSLMSGATLYRGLTKEAAKAIFPDGKIDAGGEVSDKAFLSTSESEEVVRNSFGLGGVMLKIEVSGSPKGLPISEGSRNEIEKEVLLPRNAKMKVLGVTPPKSVFDPVVVRVSYGA